MNRTCGSQIKMFFSLKEIDALLSSKSSNVSNSPVTSPLPPFIWGIFKVSFSGATFLVHSGTVSNFFSCFFSSSLVMIDGAFRGRPSLMLALKAATRRCGIHDSTAYRERSESTGSGISETAQESRFQKYSISFHIPMC